MGKWSTIRKDISDWATSLRVVGFDDLELESVKNCEIKVARVVSGKLESKSLEMNRLIIIEIVALMVQSENW